MRIALCNEVLRYLPFARQCEVAALGYDGLEISLFALGDAPHPLTDAEIAALRRQVAAGLAARADRRRVTGRRGGAVSPSASGSGRASMQVLCTATATAIGGRQGRIRSSDGVLDHPLAHPRELGGPGGAAPADLTFRRRAAQSPAGRRSRISAARAPAMAMP